MKSIFEFQKIFIHRSPVDMRKGVSGLSAVVAEEMGLDLKSSSLFIFTNRRRTLMKMIYFDRSGFALWFKKLEEEKFPWPKNFEESTIQIEASDMKLLLDGVNVWTRFVDVNFERVV